MTTLGSDGPLRFLAALLIVLLAWVLRPVLAAIVIGSFAALVGHGPYERMVLASRGRRGLAASLATAAVGLIVLVPLATTMMLAAWEATDALRFVSRDDEAARAFRALLARLPTFVSDQVPAIVESAKEALIGFVGRPFVGTGLIAVPLIAGVALTGQAGKAIGLTIWFLVIVGASDHLLRPLVSKGQMALPRPLLFLTLFGGLQVFGPIGLLVGPLLGSLAVVALRLCARPSA